MFSCLFWWSWICVDKIQEVKGVARLKNNQKIAPLTKEEVSYFGMCNLLHKILLLFTTLTEENFFIMHYTNSDNSVGKFILWLTLGSPIVWPTVYTIVHEISVQN